MKIPAATPLFLAAVAFFLAHTTPVAAADVKVRKIPFHGKLQSVDASANTITLEGKKATRTFHVTAETKITDGSGNPSTLASAVAGEDVGGSYTKDASGSMELYSLRLGAKDGSKAAAEAPVASAAATSAPKPAPAPAVAPASTATETAAVAPSAANTDSTKAKKQRFSGKVVSVDAAANTLVVHGKADQTFTTTSSTKITGAAGLSAVAAGDKVTGSYEKSEDGATLTVISLKVSK